jgi:hypothetical protein
MIYYAIRHKPTGYYMPAGDRRHTKEEPKKDCIPRLFKCKSDAKLALIWWLQGVTYTIVYDDTGEIGQYERLIKTPHRKAEDMEIVTMQLSIVTDSEHALDSLILWKVAHASSETR